MDATLEFVRSNTLAGSAIESFLSERGFEISDHLNSKEIEENYLSFDDDTLWGHVTGSFRIVKAIIRK